jgi:hypothetical protein
VLGGKEKIRTLGESDASLGTAKKNRSILGHGVRLGLGSGWVYGKCNAAGNVAISIFEGELDGSTGLMQSVYREQMLLDDIGIETALVPLMMGDNWAVADFLQGRGSASKSKHMRIRGFKLREELKINGYEFLLVPGEELGADLLTKANNKDEHLTRARDIMGLLLLDIVTNEQLIAWLQGDQRRNEVQNTDIRENERVEELD